MEASALSLAASPATAAASAELGSQWSSTTRACRCVASIFDHVFVVEIADADTATQTTSRDTTIWRAGAVPRF